MTKKTYTEEQIKKAYIKERESDFGGNLKIREKGAKELIRILREIKDV